MVRDGYDSIAEAYAGWNAATGVKARYLHRVTDLVPAGGRILDLGCGTGERVTRHLVEQYRVMGVDISPHSIEVAKREVPGAVFLCADMTCLQVESGSFDAVVAFFSIIHVPKEEQPSIFSSIYRWLRPGGHAILTLDTSGVDLTDQFLGAPMFWSSWDRPHYMALLTEAGFNLVSALDETELEDDLSVTFLWVVLQRPLSL